MHIYVLYIGYIYIYELYMYSFGGRKKYKFGMEDK